MAKISVVYKDKQVNNLLHAGLNTLTVGLVYAIRTLYSLIHPLIYLFLLFFFFCWGGMGRRVWRILYGWRILDT